MIRELIFWCAAFLMVFFFAGKAFAEDAEVEEVVYEDIVAQTDIIVRGGVPGIWFPMEIARAVLSDVRELPLLRRQISLFSQQLELRSQQIDRVNQQLENEVSARELLMGEIEGYQSRVERAEDRESAWYKSPVLWFVIGSVCTVALVVAGAFILRSIQPGVAISVD